jgi:hypothetical protein
MDDGKIDAGDDIGRAAKRADFLGEQRRHLVVPATFCGHGRLPDKSLQPGNMGVEMRIGRVDNFPQAR